MTLSASRVLVTGGTGFIGGRLVEKLILDYGADVRVLVRNFSHASRIARFDLEMVAGDIGNAAAVDSAAKDRDIVFHCAYEFTGTRKLSRRVNVGGTGNVAKAALRHGARLVHVSTVDVYGWPAEGQLDENAPRRGVGNLYAETKLAAERLVLGYCEGHGLAASVIQPTIVYGPFSIPWTITPIKQLKSGQVPLVDGGNGCCNAVYIDDVVDAMVLAATTREAEGESFLISGPEPITWREFYGALETALGLKATVPVSAKELERLSSPLAKLGSEWKQFISRLRDPEVHMQMMQFPLVGRVYTPFQHLPRRAKDLIFQKLLNPDSVTNQPSEPIEGAAQMHLPDSWKLRVYRSQARVVTEKASRLLGYEPKFDFERGMELTAEFIRWANLAR